MTNIFITATDTDAGKTLVASALIYKLVSNQFKVSAFKPVSAGCSLVDGHLINEDAKQLHKYANCQQTIQDINPIAFEEPIAPHIAASKAGKQIKIDELEASFNNIKSLNANINIIEGAGGWRLPLGQNHYLSELAMKLDCKVILVVNMKLGCLNHALLTYQAIQADGLEVVGWVANCYQGMSYLDENIDELTQTFSAPYIGEIGYVNSIEEASNCLNIDRLLTSLA